MLVNLPESDLKLLRERQVTPVARGVMRTNSLLGLAWELRQLEYDVDEYPFMVLWQDVFDLKHGSDAQEAAIIAAEASPAHYGVCDEWNQIIERWPELDSSTRHFIIEARYIDRDSSDGWRWRKWGEYIGDQEPQCEYLADEPVIDRVLVFRILEITG